jgi:hypothetical protein
MDAMPAIPRRVVTGHNERGVSVFILVAACFTVELLDSRGGDVLGGLLHDPMKGEA